MLTRRTRRSKLQYAVGSLVTLLGVGAVINFVYFPPKQGRQLATGERRSHRYTTTKTTTTIHFIETSLNPQISGRQCCSVESAARNHPSYHVILWLRKQRTLDDICPGLSRLTTIKIRIYVVEDLLAGSPLLVWLARTEGQRSGRLRSRFPSIHLGDALRLAVLYIHGGVYLDLDIIIISKYALVHLPSDASLGREAPTSLGNSFLAFPKGHRFLKQAMREFADTFRGDLWAFNGPRLLERVIHRWGCSPELAMSCNDIYILNHTAFYPVPYQNWSILFSGSSSDMRILDVGKQTGDAYLGVHLWNSASSNRTVPTKSLLHRLAVENCPNTLKGGRPL